MSFGIQKSYSAPNLLELAKPNPRHTAAEKIQTKINQLRHRHEIVVFPQYLEEPYQRLLQGELEAVSDVKKGIKRFQRTLDKLKNLSI